MPSPRLEPLPSRSQRDSLPRRHGGKGLAIFRLYYSLRPLSLSAIGPFGLGDKIVVTLNLVLGFSIDSFIEHCLKTSLPYCCLPFYYGNLM